MARVPDLVKFAKRHGLLVITIADSIRYRMANERLVKRVAAATLPTEFGDFRLFAFESLLDGQTHVALVCGDVGDGIDIMVRVHSKCLTGDVFHSARCDCGPQLHTAMKRIAEEGRGVSCVLESGGPRDWTGRQDSRGTSCRTRVSTPSRRTSDWASSRTSGITASARRFWRPGGQDDAPPDEQSAKVRRLAGLWAGGLRIGSTRDSRL